MPELPEVEVTRRGIAELLTGATITDVVVRNGSLRYPVPAGLSGWLRGQVAVRFGRRAKYLLVETAAGTLIVHLGMTGTLRVLPADTPLRLHDHVDIVFGAQVLRYHDPRRFGAMLWLPAGDDHPLLGGLGVEPLTGDFDGEYLYRASRGRRTPIKLFIMDAAVVVGVGNIYASESLFRARINPKTPAGRLSRERCTRLAGEIKATLTDALAAGGSTLRDFVASDGSRGYFQQQYFAYGREGEACRVCGREIRRLVMGQRSTFYCPSCQR
ncbi:bifunctional DNA-formamidopyrimidine glycosylase/DNA-(apurinic or apyrimidinic site) lyase [Uliginosibacterium sp. sgz301328]|uniref:bifunctional DNA-formamidopyrimidine glycosylase/DNA-(apurinic or apyrimidinic site) lyase n=1 Tax=Uliginosibacterium sp. sgz301328 TaxID=3243764 RepID=UPI00359D650B